jgi:hypothetical protein
MADVKYFTLPVVFLGCVCGLAFLRIDALSCIRYACSVVDRVSVVVAYAVLVACVTQIVLRVHAPENDPERPKGRR